MTANSAVEQCSDRTVEAQSNTLTSPIGEGISHRLVRYLIFTCLVAMYLFPFMRLLLPWSNEGTLASGAVRIVHGQVFARDFFEVMGPGTFYILAAFFKVFGISFVTMRLYLFLTSLGTAIAMYYLTRRVFARYSTAPCILLFATYYGLQWPGVSHHVDSNCFALLSVATLAVWHQTRAKSALLAAGVLAGITTCIHQPKGFLLLVGIICWLIILRRKSELPLWSLFLPIYGYLGVGGFVLGCFWKVGALGSLYYANVVWPSHNYEAVNRVPYALGIFHEYWSHWIIPNAHWSIGLALVLITPFLFVAALPLIVAILCVAFRKKLASPFASLFLVCGGALWLSEFHRHDIYHLVFGSPLLIILVLYLLTEARQRWSDLALQLVVVTAGCLATFNLFAAATAHSMPTRVGPVAVYKNTGVIDYLDSHTVQGEEIFAYPYCPIYYFLTATSNPTRYLTMTYNYNSADEFKDAIRTLEEQKTRYVVWDSKFMTEVAPVVFTKAARNPPSGFLMEDYLESHYRIAKDFDGVRVMERKSENPSHNDR
jgi:4-amino-4-deoxy-L-arabinose transferase-like glycosyltransferase